MYQLVRDYFDAEHFSARDGGRGGVASGASTVGKQSPRQISVGLVSLSFGLVVAVALLNRSLPGLDLFLLHLVPVGLVAWRGGFAHGLGMALISAAVHYLTNPGPEHPHAALLQAANAALAFGVFALAAWSLARLKEYRNRARALRAQLDESHPDRATAAAEVRRLHHQLRVYQAWTHHIKRAGRWVSLEDFLGVTPSLKTFPNPLEQANPAEAPTVTAQPAPLQRGAPPRELSMDL
ncbi:MAG: hypothetical protein HYY24_25165 [Verrucomicrobia bacterium]|nr:hypothetical protein [Verrucomicrobiota bacterium]